MLYVELPGGFKMPALGYGTFQAANDQLEKALEIALEVGYRHIDTASSYQNEKVIGKVLQRWITSGKLTRGDLFIVTKLPPTGNRPSGVAKYLKKSLEDLQLDYVDLYLIHTPFSLKEVEDGNIFDEDGKALLDTTTDHVAMWKEMEKQVQAGLAKSIGLSNFNIRQITRVLENSAIKPANLQVELHVYHQQKELVDFCKKNNISVTAYAPLGCPGLNILMEKMGHKIELPNILQDKDVKVIAKKHNKTAAQVLLRYLVQNGLTIIPKSTNPERVRQNFRIFDFFLDVSDRTILERLDKGDAGRIVDFLVLNGIEEHPEYPFEK